MAGSRYLQGLQAEGGERGLSLRIHVESNNPAMRLYTHLGFRKVDTNGVYWLMQWQVTAKLCLINSQSIHFKTTSRNRLSCAWT